MLQIAIMALTLDTLFKGNLDENLNLSGQQCRA